MWLHSSLATMSKMKQRQISINRIPLGIVRVTYKKRGF
jgi:hypothetical protein